MTRLPLRGRRMDNFERALLTLISFVFIATVLVLTGDLNP